MAGIARLYDTLGVPYERLDPDELRRRYPQLTFPEGTIGLYQAGYGILAATRCVLAFAARARADGAALHEEEPVREIAPDGDGVAVRTDRETYRAGRVILTAGSWTPPLLASLGIDLPLTVLQEQLAFFRVRDPEAHTPDRLPLVMHRFPGTTSIGSVFPIFDHEGVKVMIDRKFLSTYPDSVLRTRYSVLYSVLGRFHPHQKNREPALPLPSLFCRWLRESADFCPPLFATIH